MCMRHRPGSLLLVVLILIASGASRAEALRFDGVDAKKLPAGVKSALWARDCDGDHFNDDDCKDNERHFTKGDAARLAAALMARSYDEVWLSSGGGSLDEGIAVGEVFRRFQVTVRVPPGHSCVSACTVAFLGGVFRYVDPGATYEVHAASVFLNATTEDPDVKMLLKDPRSAKDVATALLIGEPGFKGARASAQELLLHFQKALYPLGALPAAQEQTIRNQFRALLQTSPAFGYPESQQFVDDVARIQREGAPAAQEILMRLERDAMQVAITELRPLIPSLGARAEPALRMLEAMYSSRITGTASLNHQTLVHMGYVTQLFDPTH